MEKYRRYYGVIALVVAIAVLILGSYKIIFPNVNE